MGLAANPRRMSAVAPRLRAQEFPPGNRAKSGPLAAILGEALALKRHGFTARAKRRQCGRADLRWPSLSAYGKKRGRKRTQRPQESLLLWVLSRHHLRQARPPHSGLVMARTKNRALGKSAPQEMSRSMVWTEGIIPPMAGSTQARQKIGRYLEDERPGKGLC